MIKKTLATLAFLVLASPALAVCPTPLTGKDGGGTTQNFLISVDPSGNCVSTLIHALISNTSLASWTSATAGNTNIDIPLSGNVPNVVVTLDNTAVTTGAVTIRGLKANGSYEAVGVSQVVNHSTFGPLTNPYTLPTGGATGALAQDFLVGTQGYKSLNVQLSTAITGAGTLAVSYTLVGYPVVNWALINPLSAGSAIIGQVGINQTTLGTTNKVVADAIVTPSASFVRPANVTAYASGQLVANSTTAGSVTPMSWTATPYSGGNFYVRRFRMTLSGKSVTNTSFRLHLFTVTPATITNGDGGALSVTSANEFCQMDVTIATAGADVSIGYGTPVQGSECNGVAVATTVFGLLEARAAYTPTSGETITVIPEIHQN